MAIKVEDMETPGYVRPLLALLLILFLYISTAKLYTPLHEISHLIACISNGFPVENINLLGHVRCAGVGWDTGNNLKSFLVYTAPYLSGLTIILGFHGLESKIVKTWVYPWANILAHMSYTDIIGNIFVFPFLAYGLSIPKFAKTDAVKIAKISMELSVFILLIGGITILVWGWKGRFSSERLYEKTEYMLKKFSIYLDNFLSQLRGS